MSDCRDRDRLRERERVSERNSSETDSCRLYNIIICIVYNTMVPIGSVGNRWLKNYLGKDEDNKNGIYLDKVDKENNITI